MDELIRGLLRDYKKDPNSNTAHRIANALLRSEFISNLEVECYLVVSTAHITEEEDELLNYEPIYNHPFSKYFSRIEVPFGWIVSTILAEEDIDPGNKEFDEFRNIAKLLKFAKSLGMTGIWLDGSGPFIDGFEKFDW